ncbi:MULTISPECIES: RDD family protein [Lysobacter]|uniref:RDD family protein n=1 Tax=Lysobacter TaxID=68 RepID=UPI001F1BCD1A|nr:MULTISPECIES: RDD family protein [Lysobacter]UJB18885.1 RDD family protein [Lysobacter capsici]UJQ27390.1 RDD family protein [Lysobacter gummosus]
MSDEHNPYQVVSRVSAAPIPTAYAQAGYEAAGYGRRFANYLIDSTIAGMIKVAIIIVVGRSAIYHSPLKDVFFTFAIIMVYYIMMEGLFGATVGKFVTGTRVVDNEDQPPGWGNIIVRTLGRCIPFEPFSIFFSGEDRIAWHDRLSETRVVRKS